MEDQDSDLELDSLSHGQPVYLPQNRRISPGKLTEPLARLKGPTSRGRERKPTSKGMTEEEERGGKRLVLAVKYALTY